MAVCVIGFSTVHPKYNNRGMRFGTQLQCAAHYSVTSERTRTKPNVLPEHCLHIDNSLGVGHVIFLGTHRALLIHNNQIIGIDNATLQQAVQAGAQTQA